MAATGLPSLLSAGMSILISKHMGEHHLVVVMLTMASALIVALPAWYSLSILSTKPSIQQILMDLHGSAECTIPLVAFLSSSPFHCALPKVGTDLFFSVSLDDEQNEGKCEYTNE